MSSEKEKIDKDPSKKKAKKTKKVLSSDRIQKGYKVEIEVSSKQRNLFRKYFDGCRFVYNLFLEEKLKVIEDNKMKAVKDKIPSAYDFSKKLPELKEKHKFLKKCYSKILQYELDFGQAATNKFFKDLKDPAVKKKSQQRFKSKRNNEESFTLDNIYYITNDEVKLPGNLIIKLKQKGYIPIPTPKDSKIDDKNKIKATRATITYVKNIDKYYLSVLIEEPKPLNIDYIKNQKIGIDLGMITLATCSDRTIYNHHPSYEKDLEKNKKIQKKLSKQTKGSKRYKKTKKKLAYSHRKISNSRLDTIHKATTKIINENQVIVLEDLSVESMMNGKNHGFKRNLMNSSFYEFKRQIEYKGRWNNRNIIIADKYYASSKICSNCKHKKDKLPLKERQYHCEKCGLDINRDLNAALNLKSYEPPPPKEDAAKLKNVILKGDQGRGSAPHVENDDLSSFA